MTSVSCKQEALASTTLEKKVFPWYVYIDGSSFKDIEPVKEIISSISVFGNPPKSFIDECHQNHIEVYQAVGGNEETIDTPQKRKALVEKYISAYANDYAVTGDIKGRQVYQSVPDSINGILPSPTWLCYEKVNMYLYDGTDGNRHMFYASDAKSTEALLELADELGISQIGFWHFNSVDPQMWDTTAKWKKK